MTLSGLTLTWDVLKSIDDFAIDGLAERLTLTWDVLKFHPDDGKLTASID